jgi:hypothetical protein
MDTKKRDSSQARNDTVAANVCGDAEGKRTMLVIKIGGGAAIGEGGYTNFAEDLATGSAR